MDISALSEDKFNASDWINVHYKKYLEENAQTENADKKTTSNDDEANNSKSLGFINSYVSKLQLYVQQVNYAVEETSNKLVASMPRIVNETRTLQHDVAQLQHRMQAMRQEVADVQEETGSGMATLERLNSLQTKLQAAKESLQESDGWGNLIAALEDGFERNDLQSVCEKLVALQKSLQAQESLHGHAERQTQVEDFKNRLEALASPSVVQCFAESSLEQAQHYAHIFSSIERLPQLQQYYRAVQKNTLQQLWKQTLDLQAAELGSSQQHFLTHFYEQLLEYCQRQVKWCAQVFNDTGALQPFLVIAELLPSLQPTRDAHILQLFKTTNERLELLQQYAQANQTFVLHLNACLQQCDVELTPALRSQIAEAIFEYFYKFIQQYPRLEETQLSTQVDRLLINQATPTDAVHYLHDCNGKVFDWLQQACQRCNAITDDLALCKLIALLASIFKRVLDNFAKTQRQLSLSVGSASAEHWSLLQCTMLLMQALADFQSKLNKFERVLHERMCALLLKLNAAAESSVDSINLYSVYDRAEQKRLLANIQTYQQKRADSQNVLSLGIFTQIYVDLKTHFVEAHDIALSILLQPIEAQMLHMQAENVTHSTSPHASAAVDLPTFSYVPQECITQIGQYLLTLPQHLEPLLLSPSALLKQALELCNVKYTQHQVCADILLSLVVEQCCVLYQAQILQIKTLPASAAKQLAVDIEYLSNVLEELGLTLTLHLSQILTLLKATPDSYLNMSSGCEPRLVTAIRQMRNIISTQ